MRRLQLFELEDQSWFPALLRRAMTDFLAMAGELTDAPYRDFVHRLREAMEALGERRLVDMCSGGSGPVKTLVRLLESQEGYPVQATLTDLYPDVDAFERVRHASAGRIDYVSSPVDATAVPPELQGFRLVCNGFHHLNPEQARRVLEDVVRQRRGIAVLEIVERSLPSMLATAMAPLNMLLLTPLIKPRRLSRFLLTYLLPVLPLATLWDGLVSCLRVYSEEDLRALTAGLGGSDYRWDIARLRVGRSPLHVMTLIGQPLPPRPLPPPGG